MTEYDEGESVTVSTTAIGLTSARINGRSEALIVVETAAVRYWKHGETPTATVGVVLEPGDILTLDSEHSLQTILFIRRDGADATLRCSYGS